MITAHQLGKRAFIGAKLNICVLRPTGTTFWMPVEICRRMKLKAGARLTQEQWEDREVVALLSVRSTMGRRS